MMKNNFCERFLGLSLMSVSLMAQTTYKVDLAPFPKPEKDKSKLLLRFHILKTMETRRLKFLLENHGNRWL